MWQFSARPVITAASTHLLLRTYGNTTYSSSQIQPEQMLLPHTDILPEYSIRPFSGHYLWFSVWAAPVHKPTLICLEPGKLSLKKENVCGSGSHWAVNELPPPGSFPSTPDIDVNREGSQKAQWSGYYRE